MNLIDSMDGNGWSYDVRGNGFTKGVLWISWADAEAALADAEAGIDRSAPANDDAELTDAS